MINFFDNDMREIWASRDSGSTFPISKVYFESIQVWPSGTPPTPIVYYYFNISPTAITVDSTSQNFTITATTDSPLWEIVSTPSWLTFSGATQIGNNEYSLVFSVENNTGNTRQDFITFRYQRNSRGAKAFVVMGITQERSYFVLYKTTSGNIVTPNVITGWGANIISNVYSEGFGKLTFDGAPNNIPSNAFSGKTDLTQLYVPTSITSIGSSAFTNVKYINLFYEGTYTQWQNVSLGTDYIMDSGTLHYQPLNKSDANYVYYSPLGTTTKNFNFGIPLTTGTTVHFVCQTAGYTIGGILLGCLYTTSDNDDWRFFQAASTTSYFDWKSSRVSGNIGLATTSGQTWDVKLENFKVTNVTTGQYVSGTSQTSVPSSNAMIGIRTNYCKIKSVEIQQDGSTVFNMTPCTCDGIAGFYDSVSDTFMTMPGLVADAMTYSFAIDSIKVIDDSQQTFSLTATTDSPQWQVVSVPSWLTFNGSAATGDNTWRLDFSASENTGSSRSDSVVIQYMSTPAGAVATASATITQGLPCNEIWYASTGGTVVQPYSTGSTTYGANIVSNTYVDGGGVILFDNCVTKIGEQAFRNCESLSSIMIPDSVTSIGLRAFNECTSLSSITIPNSVTSIGNDVFDFCISLSSVTIGSGVTSIGSGAFSRCGNLSSITIPNSVTSIGNNAFNGCGLSSITIPDSITSIEHNTFVNCSRLSSITIPNSVTTIGGHAFGSCTSLPSIVIPDSVTSIGEGIFGSCTSLSSVTIGSGVATIRYNAFHSCTSLPSIVIPDSITTIGMAAFANCTGLYSVTIGSGVTSIGENAFRDCRNLSHIRYNGTKTQWAAITKGTDWHRNVQAGKVHCTDGDAPL